MWIVRTLVIGLMMTSYLASQGCAAYMHEMRPLHRNVDVLEPGTDRSLVLQELGLPEQNYPLKEGGQVDVYKIALTSETTGSKVAWTGLHIVADMLTLFLWELVATTAERVTQPEVRTYVVSYGADNKIQRVASYGEGVPFSIPS